MTDRAALRREHEEKMAGVQRSIDKHHAKAKAAEALYSEMVAERARLAVQDEPPANVEAVKFTRTIDGITYTYAAVRHDTRTRGLLWSVTGRASLTNITWERLVTFAASGCVGEPAFTYLVPLEGRITIPVAYSDRIPPGSVLIGNFASAADGVPYHFAAGGIIDPHPGANR